MVHTYERRDHWRAVNLLNRAVAAIGDSDEVCAVTGCKLTLLDPIVFVPARRQSSSRRVRPIGGRRTNRRREVMSVLGATEPPYG